MPPSISDMSPGKLIILMVVVSSLTTLLWRVVIG